MKNGEYKVENLNTQAFQPNQTSVESAGLRSAFSAPSFFTILIGLLAFASPIIAAEIGADSADRIGHASFLDGEVVSGTADRRS